MSPLPLLCRIGRHDPDPIARWNQGYYFSRCRRCGSDLVRSAYGRWHVPHGYRIVWRPRGADDALEARMVRRGGAGDGLPIEEVLRHLQAEAPAPAPVARAPLAARAPSAGRAAVALSQPMLDTEALALAEPDRQAAAEAPPAPSPVRSAIPDFMDDGAEASGPWPDSPSPSAARADPPARRASSKRPRFPRRIGLDGSDRLGPIVAGGPFPDRGALRFTYAAAILVGFALVLVLAMLAPRLGLPGFAPARDAPASGVFRSPLPAFVTASLLNCRSAPSAQAEPVRRLARGEPVLLLARDGRWMSVAHEGGQCWALARYLSTERPVP